MSGGLNLGLPNPARFLLRKIGIGESVRDVLMPDPLGVEKKPEKLTVPPPPPAPPTRDDPAIAEARRRSRLSALRGRGRGSTIIAGETTSRAPLSQPRAGAQLLGE